MQEHESIQLNQNNNENRNIFCKRGYKASFFDNILRYVT